MFDVVYHSVVHHNTSLTFTNDILTSNSRYGVYESTHINQGRRYKKHMSSLQQKVFI